MYIAQVRTYIHMGMVNLKDNKGINYDYYVKYGLMVYLNRYCHVRIWRTNGTLNNLFHT